MIPTVNLNKITITNLTGGFNNSFTFFGILPDEIPESHTANYQPMEIQSRSGQMWSYYGGNSRVLTLNITVHEDYLIDYGHPDIREYAAKFKALTYPKYDGFTVHPPYLMVRVGTFILFKGVCTNSSVNWKRPIREDKYIVADFALEMSEANSLAFHLPEIYGMDDLRRV